MAETSTVISHLDDLLQMSKVPDYPGAHNGLQLANDGVICRVAAAVDACLPVIQQAVDQEVDLLLVHHGMFWSGVQPIRDAYYQKLKLAMEHNLAIYSAHIPLDIHESLGNNAQLIQTIGVENSQSFFPWKGVLLGQRAEVDWSRDECVQRVQKAIGGSRVHCSAGGPSRVRQIAVITGGAGSEVAAVAAQGIDTFITGEGPHHTYALAEELGVNLLYAGHYATETFGVKALATHMSEKFDVPWDFIDHPSGL
jgi:dinuclear metal center YbgI/SA1388 family protein